MCRRAAATPITAGCPPAVGSMLVETFSAHALGELPGPSHPGSCRLPGSSTGPDTVSLPSLSPQVISAVPEATEHSLGAPQGWGGCRKEHATPCHSRVPLRSPSASSASQGWWPEKPWGILLLSSLIYNSLGDFSGQSLA